MQSAVAQPAEELRGLCEVWRDGRKEERGSVHVRWLARTADLDRSLQLKQHRLLEEDLARRRAQRPDVGLQQSDLFPRPASTHLEQHLNHRVHVERRSAAG